MSSRRLRAETEPLGLSLRSDVEAIELVVVGGPDEGAVLESRGPRLRIGRDDSNELTLTDAAVSGFHCEILVEGGRARVCDLQSRNGILLNGTKLCTGELTDGALLSLGTTQIRCRIRGPVALAPDNDPSPSRFGIVSSRSPAMREVLRLLESAARSEVTVLLTGATGTGKGAAAESLHHASQRAGGPFVTVDCGAITPTLLESQLFGHTKGAFTGATSDRPGAFEAANGGTVFLDEIGELPLEVQPVLLRALETRRIRRVGANEERPVDVRLVAATNRNLRRWVEEHRFRADLFYRLAVLEIGVPALRERPEDVALIVSEMVERVLSSRRDQATLVVAAQLTAPAHLAAMQGYPWPGNVRELRNYVHRCFALHELVGLEELSRERSSARL